MIGLGVLMFLRGDAVGGLWLGFIGLFLSQAARSAEVQATFAGRIEGLRVADVMDEEPVAIPETLTLDRAEEEFFLRYGWPWFPVVDASGRLVGVVSREAVDSVAEQVRPSRPVASVMARDDGDSGLRVRLEDPLETLLGREGLARLGRDHGRGRRGRAARDRDRRPGAAGAPARLSWSATASGSRSSRRWVKRMTR